MRVTNCTNIIIIMSRSFDGSVITYDLSLQALFLVLRELPVLVKWYDGHADLPSGKGIRDRGLLSL